MCWERRVIEEKNPAKERCHGQRLFLLVTPHSWMLPLWFHSNNTLMGYFIFFLNEDVINTPFSLRNYPRDLRVAFPKDVIPFLIFLVADCENGEDYVCHLEENWGEAWNFAFLIHGVEHEDEDNSLRIPRISMEMRWIIFWENGGKAALQGSGWAVALCGCAVECKWCPVLVFVWLCCSRFKWEVLRALMANESVVFPALIVP